MYRDVFKLFSEKRIDIFFDEIKKEISDKVELINNLEVLELNKDSIIDELYEKSKITIPSLDINNIESKAYQVDIPAEKFPSSPRFDVKPGKKYKVNSAIYKIPFKGNSYIFKLIPSPRISYTEYFFIEKNSFLCFEILDFNKDVNIVKNKKEQKINFLLKQYEYVKSNINFFNSGIRDYIKSICDHRENELKDLKDFGDNL